MITFLWAQAANGVIGNHGRLPWHLPDDLAFFKRTTLGQLTLMGRTTYEGLPTRPLPNRTNLVLTRQADYQAPGAVVVASVQAALDYAAGRPLIVTGGAQVFAAFTDHVQTLLVTRIAADVAGDVVMPPLPWADFARVSMRAVGATDAQPAHQFERWERRA